MDKVDNVFKLLIGALMSWLGVLAVPVFLLVGCNIIDYITGLIASKYRDEAISSKKGIKGIIKKVCLWLLVLIGAWVDILISYSISSLGVEWKFPFLIGSITAVWLTWNEIISILENMLAIGVKLPPFLMPLIERMQKKTEELIGEENHD